MRAAAAVLGASLLFFLGVLTGAGRREALPPPSAIPLGVLTTAGAAGSPGLGGPPTTPATRPATRPAARAGQSGPPGAPAGPEAPAPTTAPAAKPATPPATAAPQPGPPAAPAATAPAGPATTTTAPPATTTSTRPGHVEHVGNQVDCTSPGQRGRGQRHPCPSASPSGEQPGGRSGR